MSKDKKSSKPHGQIRQSQVVTTFGPGAVVDLPKHSVIVAGLEHWQGVSEEIREPRLVDKLQEILEIQDLKLYSPPPEEEDPSKPRTGITAWVFPEWFIAQEPAENLKTGGRRARYLVHRKSLTKDVFIDPDKRKLSVVPIRFVRACRGGHIGDIDWRAFVHQGQSCTRQLWIEELGTSGDLGEVFVSCECGKRRKMGEAADPSTHSLGNCDGSRPWLGPNSKEPCDQPNRLLVKTASNAYFPQILSVISLPEGDDALTEAIHEHWESRLQYVESLEDLQRERAKVRPVREALKDFSDDEVLQAIEARRSGRPSGSSAKTVKQAEFEALMRSKETAGPTKLQGDFCAVDWPRKRWGEHKVMAPVEKVVLIHRLREVVAQLGFSRFEAVSPDVEGELEINVTRAGLSREATWLPAIENRGEGVFIGFKSSEIGAWLARPEVANRGQSLLSGFEGWKKDHKGSKRVFFGLPYVMLHSLSHLLITAVSLECGYPASSIRERVYAGEYGHGIMLYTGSPDSEGTLGGLVEVAKRIPQHLERAVETGRLCSNDPVCAQHDPTDQNDRRFLHGAACHGCLLIAETSCEQHNDFLDRALVVPTVTSQGSEFFSVF